MVNKTCPKCKQKVESEFECTRCGINFEKYEFSKQEKLREVRILLGESKFKEAKQLAETLPALFPDNQGEFLLILSNINRDISIVAKCELTQKAIDDSNYSQATFLLRNIKAFDDNLNEKVISLRRKAERYIQNDINFSSGIAEFNMGNYSKAKQLLKNIEGHKNQDEIVEHLHKIEAIQKEMLNRAIDYIKKNQLTTAADEFNALLSKFPDMKDEIEDYTALLSKRADIKDDIFRAAHKAKEEKRFLESKILYLFMGMQFPESQPQVQPYINEIGTQVIVSLADIDDNFRVDIAALGIDINTAVSPSTLPDAADNATEQIDPDELVEITPVEANKEGETDLLCAPVDIDGEGVADFIY